MAKTDTKLKTVQAGVMMKSKEGSYYLKFTQTTDKDGNPVGVNPFPLVLNDGDILSLEKPRDNIDFKVMKGWLTEEQGESIKDRLPDFLKFFIFAKVKSDSTSASKKKSIKKQTDDSDF